MLRAYFHALRHLLGIVAAAWRDPRVHILLVLGASILATGTMFYHAVEGWTWLDSLYFSTVTLATVGYGDLHPATDLGKLFTIFFIVIGVGVFVGIFAFIARGGTSPDAPPGGAAPGPDPKARP